MTEQLLLGRYRLGAQIGRGGMSVVHRGEDTLLGRPVAIKLLAPHLSADARLGRRLLGEARAAARLSHPNVVQVLDAGETEDGTLALVMELVEGETLAARLKQGPLPVDEAREIAAQVAGGLAAAHERGIVHRDVKPGNVLLTRSGDAKLADFGIARSLDATSTMTPAGVVMGSAPYVAPEVLKGERADARADIYALGVTLFQMLAGRLPFEGESAAAALTARLSREAPRVRSLRPEVPPDLDELAARCLERDSSRRLGTAALAAQALREAGMPAAPEALAPTEAIGIGGRVRPQALPRMRVAAGIGVAALALLLVAWRLSAGAHAPAERAAVTPMVTSMAAPTGVPPSVPTAAPTSPAAPTPTAIVIRLR